MSATSSSPPPPSFDGLAETFDRYRTGYADDVYDALADYGVRPGAHVLDVACGTGLVAGALVARGMRVTGLDLSQPMLDVARKRVGGATFVRGDAEELPFPAGSFDAVTSAQAYHWLDADRALHEAIRVVRPGGIVAIWWKELLRGDATRLVRESAYRDVGVALSPPPIASEDFTAFERAPLVDRRLRVIPWFVETTAADFLGYERSRARARAAVGAQLEAYLDALGRRLGTPDTRLRLAYLHLLYLGRVSAGPAAGH